MGGIDRHIPRSMQVDPLPRMYLETDTLLQKTLSRT